MKSVSISKVVDFNDIGENGERGTGDQDYGKGVVRLHTSLSNDFAQRNSLVKVTNKTENLSVYLILKYKSAKDFTQSQMALEYDTRQELNIAKGEEIDVEISNARFYCWWNYLISHPDFSVRIPFIVGIIISLLLFILSVMNPFSFIF